MTEFKIDFFELLFLAESVIPRGPIARSMCFGSFSENHYHKMNDKQRVQFFKHVKEQSGFKQTNEQCLHFYNRFNPDNQYKVCCMYKGKPEIVYCYLHDGQYRVSMDSFVDRKYIESIDKVNYKSS